jgi:hypothetical protein
MCFYCMFYLTFRLVDRSPADWDYPDANDNQDCKNLCAQIIDKLPSDRHVRD